jgi:hypothetical protein
MSQEVFGKAPVDVALCDDSFKPLRTIAFQPPKPTLPVTVTFRKSIGGGSLVAQFTNTSSRVLAVKACLLNGTFRQFDVIALELPPGRRVEHGWLEGWKFASGETIFLEHSDYEPASFNVP